MSTYLISWAIVPNDFGYREAFSATKNRPVSDTISNLKN